MSSGTQNYNRRYNVQGPYSPAGVMRSIGSTFTKTWSGTNYPSGRVSSVLGWKPVKGKRPKRAYVRKPKRSRIEEHPYTVNFDTTTVGLTVRTLKSTSVKSDSASNSTLAVSTWTTGWTTNDDLALLGKLREKVAGSSFNAGVFASQMPQTLDLITNSATRIAKSLILLKKGRLKQAARALTGHEPRSGTILSKKNTLGQNWLQLQYGWLPLLQDAEAGAQFIAHQLMPMQYIVRVRRQSKGSITGYTSPTNAIYNDVIAFRRRSIKCIIKEVNVPSLAGLMDPLSVAWELTPYSFVIDWFIPIGSYLEARGLIQSISATYVTSTLDKLEARGYKCTNAAYALDYSSPMPATNRGSFVRGVGTTYTVPKPSLKPLSKVASWRHAANAVALLQGIRSRL